MAISNGYATLNEVKAAARITDSVDDSLLELAIESSSRLVDGYCERVFYTTGSAVTRYFSAESNLVCSIDDVAGTAITVQTSSALDGDYDVTWSASDLQLEPLNRVASGLAFPITRLRAVGDYLFPVDDAIFYPGSRPVSAGEAGVKVTAIFGFATAIPAAIRQATIIMSLRQYKRYDSPLGVAGFGDMGAVRVGKVDPDVQAFLAPFRKSSPGIA